jgi:adenylate kinase
MKALYGKAGTMSATSKTFIVLMGVQGSGKGTQANKLSEMYSLPWITSGGLFRDMKNENTPLAREVQEIMDAGKLVPDDVTIRVVGERLSKDDAINGAILDGFPRTLPQAEALDNLLMQMSSKVTVVPFLKLEQIDAVDRILGRRFCTANEKHGGGYNLKTNPPQVEGHCDICNAPLMERRDDNLEAATKRISLFFEETAPLLDYYQAHGVLSTIDANQSIDKVTADLVDAIDEKIQAG